MLPLLLGLGGSALGAAGMLGGMGALAGGALGSGLGSLAQGDDLGTAVGTGLLSYFGGKALQGMMGLARGEMHKDGRIKVSVFPRCCKYPVQDLTKSA